MSQGAGVWTRIVAGLHGEVAAETLEGYRRAGASVYDLLDRVQRRREEAKVGGKSPWEADRGLRFQIAFAWNAFVLQTLGDQLIEADYAADSSTVGFLPRVTAEQVAALYHQVEPWVSRANQAASNPGYEPDVHLPAELPHWVEVEPCPRAHLTAMMAAVRSIRGRALIAVGAFQEDQVPKEHLGRVGLVRQRIADADTAADYALQLWAGDPLRRLHEEVEQRIKTALEGYYVAGQMLAVPELVPAARRGPSLGVAPSAAARAGQRRIRSLVPHRSADPNAVEGRRQGPQGDRQPLALGPRSTGHAGPPARNRHGAGQRGHREHEAALLLLSVVARLRGQAAGRDRRDATAVSAAVHLRRLRRGDG
jgi:hypothetical protein